MKRLRVGVIGLGIGMQHAQTVEAYPGGDLAMLCDKDPKALDQARARFPGVPCVAEASALLDADLDVVVIASYDDAHYEQARRAIERGQHLYVEKPLCLHESETRALAAFLRVHPSVRMSCNLVLRACERFQRVQQEIAAGAFGAVYHLEADYFWGRASKLVEGWRADMDFYSIIHGGAVHMVDLVLWLTGERPVSVAALGSDFASRGTRQRHNDFALLQLRFPSGLSAKVSAHGGCTHSHFHRLAVYGVAKTFAGDFPGAYWLDSSEPTVAPRAEAAAYPDREHRGRVLAGFLDVLSGAKSSHFVVESDVFAAMSVCHAAEKAVQTGRECVIDYLF